MKNYFGKEYFEQANFRNIFCLPKINYSNKIVSNFASKALNVDTSICALNSGISIKKYGSTS